VSARSDRIARLVELRAKIDAEIDQIEAEIRAEIAATARAKAAARSAGRRVRRRPEALCGTDGGYYRHRRTLGENACDACKLAHRVAEAERVARNRGEVA